MAGQPASSGSAAVEEEAPLNLGLALLSQILSKGRVGSAGLQPCQDDGRLKVCGCACRPVEGRCWPPGSDCFHEPDRRRGTTHLAAPRSRTQCDTLRQVAPSPGSRGQRADNDSNRTHSHTASKPLNTRSRPVVRRTVIGVDRSDSSQPTASPLAAILAHNPKDRNSLPWMSSPTTARI